LAATRKSSASGGASRGVVRGSLTDKAPNHTASFDPEPEQG